MKIPYNRPHLNNKELKNISDAHSRWWLAGDGYYTKKCHEWFEKKFGANKALLTTSCSAAMDIMTILANIEKGDEVIMPSFTFSSTANSVVLRGGTPVFVDIRHDTLNIDENLIEEAITSKTKAIFVVHYAGVGCEMDTIKRIAKRHKLLVLEDAAQGFSARYKGKQLGTIGDVGAMSFHETKNITSGEGGVLFVNKAKYAERAEIIREKGTNRSKFYRGEIDKYTWVDMGSSFLPSEIISAFLYAQLTGSKKIIRKRLYIWKDYQKRLMYLEKKAYLRLPVTPVTTEHNGHIFYILLDDQKTRNELMTYLKGRGILAPFHYIPLHSSPAGRKFGRYVGRMDNTNKVSSTLIRLPLFYDLKQSEIDFIVKSIENFFK